MYRMNWFRTVIGCWIVASGVGVCQAQFATQVISYNPGTTPAGGYTSSEAALGSPERFTGEGIFDAVVSPFNPPWLGSEVVSIGEGGQLTLQLSNFVIPQASIPVLGVFTNAGLIGTGDFFDQAMADLNETTGTFGIDRAVVEVSEDNVSYVSLGEVLFDIPTNGYTDLAAPYSATAGSVLSDFRQPYSGTLSDFANQVYSQVGPANDIVDTLGGSGGGTWLDLSSSGLAQVSYVRLSVADDGNVSTALNFELDAIVIGNGFAGAPVPEPSAVVLVLCSMVTLAGIVRRRRQREIDA